MARKDIGRQVDEALKKKFSKKLDISKLSKKQLELLGDVVVAEIKDSVSKGISPIEGRQRFPAYKKPDRYPGRVRKRFPRKRKRPVNLYLSGDFLSNLRFKVEKSSSFRTKSRLRIGFFDRKSILKERGHREGAKGQPSRPIIPDRNEDFKRRIKISMIKEFKLQFLKNLAKNR